MDIPRNNLGQFKKGAFYKEKRYEVNPASGCWEWLLKKDRGYGRVRVGNSAMQAHRFFYEIRFGRVPQGMTLDHLCRNRSCVNPEHLEPVTAQENVQRGASAKLDKEKVLQIRSMYKNKEYNQRELSALFGVRQDQISRIVNLRRWNNV